MTRFRFHRGGLAESLETTIEVSSLDDLRTKINAVWLGPAVDTLEVKWYAYDKRIDWNTYIVLVPDQGVAGFTDGELE